MTSKRQVLGPLESALDAAVDRRQQSSSDLPRERTRLDDIQSPSRRFAMATPVVLEWPGLSRRHRAQLQAHLREAQQQRRRADGGQPCERDHAVREGARSSSGWMGLAKTAALVLGGTVIGVASLLPVAQPGRSLIPVPRGARVELSEPEAERSAPERSAPVTTVETRDDDERAGASGDSRPVVAAASARSVSRSTLSRDVALSNVALPRKHAPGAPRAERPLSGGAPVAAASARPTKQARPPSVRGRSAEDDIVTVHDAFGIGGDEPLPAAALGAPAPRNPPSRGDERSRSGPGLALFHRNPPF